MKNFKRFLSILLVLVVVLGSAPLSGLVGLELPAWFNLSVNASDTLASGACGDKLIWTFDTETGTLEIYGTGKMYNYTSEDDNRPPWFSPFRFDIKTIIIADGVESIGDYAFSYLSYLIEVKIPESVTYIGSAAFTHCGRLKTINIPSGVETIKAYTFFYCYSLEIKIPNTITKIEDHAFVDCGGMLSIASGLEKLVIPDSVLSIGAYAFYSCKFSELEIGNNVTEIGEYAFYNCNKTKTVTMSDSVITIGNNAFMHNNALEEVRFIGTEEAWKKIDIGTDNEKLLNARICFLDGKLVETVNNSGAVIDEVAKIIYGLEEGIYDLDGYIEYEGCELEYNPTAFGFGTGTTVDIVKDGEVVDTYTIVIFGDINGDGYVDAFDLPDVMAFVNYDSQYEEDSAQEMAADINGDGFVDESDLFLTDLASTFAYTIEQSR